MGKVRKLVVIYTNLVAPFNTTSPPQTPLAYTDHAHLARFGAQKATKVMIVAQIPTIWSMAVGRPGRK